MASCSTAHGSHCTWLWQSCCTGCRQLGFFSVSWKANDFHQVNVLSCNCLALFEVLLMLMGAFKDIYGLLPVTNCSLLHLLHLYEKLCIREHKTVNTGHHFKWLSIYYQYKILIVFAPCGYLEVNDHADRNLTAQGPWRCSLSLYLPLSQNALSSQGCPVRSRPLM